MGKENGKKILLGSIIAVVLLILTSYTSVAGFQSFKPNSVKASPLFAVRVQRSADKENIKKISTDYLGKDSVLNTYLFKEKRLHNTVGKTLKLLRKNPVLSDHLIEKLETNQIYVNFLRRNDISISEFKTFLYLIKNDPLLLEEKMR